jgi:hypothetical protein
MLATVPRVGVPDSDEYAPVVATVAKPEVISLAVCVWARGVRASDRRESLPTHAVVLVVPYETVKVTSADNAPPPDNPVPADTLRVVGTLLDRSVVKSVICACESVSGSDPAAACEAACVEGVRESDRRVSLPFTTSPAAALPVAATLSAADVPRVGVPERDE